MAYTGESITSKYYRGDLTFQTLDTDAVVEASNLYFTPARVLATVLTGLIITGGTIGSTDNLLQMAGKLQNQINGISGGYVTSITGTADQVIVSSPTGAVSLSLPQSINTTSSPTFVNVTASLTGNASTATVLQNARTIGGVSFNGSANIVPQTITSNNEATDTTCFILFITASGTQSLQPKNNTGLTYNSNTNNVGATTFTGALTGNATTATTLATPRNIYGNSFDGSAALTQIIASTFGGTGNGFTKFSGPTTSEKTKTVRDATDTILELGGSYTPTGTWTSLTMVTPALGTPSAGILTSCTGLPISTGVSGLGSGVATFLATPSSSNLAAAVTGETGSGALVFGTAPTLSLPIIDNFKLGYSTTATGATTTTLTNASNYQQYFTGSTTQTLVLPVTSTLVLGESYVVTNLSTGIVTVQSSGLNTILAMPGNTQAIFTVILVTGTGIASWNAEYVGFSSITGTGAAVLATSPTLITPALGTPSVLVLTNATGLPTTGLTGTLQAAQFPALTGDVTTVAGALATTLATVNSNVGTFGSATQVSQITVNAKGLITAASNVTISGVPPGGSAGGDLSGTYPNPTVAKINTVALGSTTATAGNLLIGSGTTWVTNAVTGDITISSAGVTAISSGVIVDADINASAGIVDTKLATISTALKVSNSATTAASANTVSAIVARDGSGNFSAGTITADLTGTASLATLAASATILANTRTIWGQNFNGSANVTGSLTAITNMTGGASSMTITAGTGNSRTLILRTTTSGGTATTALTLAADQSATFANSITATSLTLSGLTLGSVLFVSTSGLIQEDNSFFFWDDTNNLLGVGTAVPTARGTFSTNGANPQTAPPSSIVHITGANSANAVTAIDAFNGVPTLQLRAANGTGLTPSAVANGDVIGQLIGTGYGASAYLANSASKISFISEQAWTNSTGSCGISFFTRPSGTTATSTLRMSLSSTGVLNIVGLTVSRALATNSSSDIVVSTTTDTELGYVSGVTSSIQTQLNGKQATGNYITALTGDVTASGPGSAAASVVKINGVALGSTTATAGNLLIASGTTWVSTAVTGNVTINSSGVTTIGALQVTNSMIANTTIDLTAKVTGLLPLANGGTNANLTASNGGIFYSTSSAAAILSGTATANKILLSGSSTTPTWSTSTIPTSAGTAGKVLISDGTNYVLSTPTYPNTSGTAGKILRSDGTNNVYTTSTFSDTYSASTILYSNGANTVQGLATANNAVLVTSATGVPSLSIAGSGITILSSSLQAISAFISDTYAYSYYGAV